MNSHGLQQAALSGLSAALFLALGYGVLQGGHPHEDAFILFIYSENWANFGEITYYKDGPPSEGATDFLWMAMIAALNLVGVNSGIAALVMNAIGTGLICWLLIRALGDVCPSGLASAFIALLLPVYLIAQASLGGFSTSLYAALVLLIVRGLHRWESKRLLWIPVLCLGLSLFRPDGIIIGIPATIIAAMFITGDQRRPYAMVVGLCAAIGLAYFAWRWSYFGEFLPLPLYVKSEGDRVLNGLAANLDWIAYNTVLVILSAVSLCAYKKTIIRYLAAAIPVLSLVVALAFAVQSQNIAYRLNAPGSVLLLYGAVGGVAFLMRWAAGRARSVAWSVYLVLGLAGVFFYWQNAVSTQRLVGYLTNDDAINFLPFLLSDRLSEETVIALSEAGRFAYWAPGRKFDLVGLNTPETARNGATVEYVAGLDPDITFVHSAGLVRHDCAAEADFCEVTAGEFEEILTRADERLNRTYNRRVPQATVAAIRYLRQNLERHAIFFVRYGSGYFHLYGVRRDGAVGLEDFHRSLERSFEPASRLSYLDMIRSRAAAR